MVEGRRGRTSRSNIQACHGRWHMSRKSTPGLGAQGYAGGSERRREIVPANVVKMQVPVAGASQRRALAEMARARTLSSGAISPWHYYLLFPALSPCNLRYRHGSCSPKRILCTLTLTDAAQTTLQT